MKLFTKRFYRNFRTIQDEFIGKPIRYMEIGVFLGHTAEWMIDHVLTHPDAQYIGIDPWEWFKPLRRRFPTEEIWKTNMLDRIDRLRMKYGHRNISFIKGFSQDILRKKLWPDTYFDLIYIDGKHTIQAVLCDYVHTWPLLKIGGVMIFDDYLQGRSDQVKVAVDTILSGLSTRKFGQYSQSSKYELLWKNYAIGIRKLAE